MQVQVMFCWHFLGVWLSEMLSLSGICMHRIAHNDHRITIARCGNKFVKAAIVACYTITTHVT